MLSKRLARVESGRCVACGACEAVCPKGAIAVWRGCWTRITPEVCIGCGKCARVCPAGCLEITERGTNP